MPFRALHATRSQFGLRSRWQPLDVGAITNRLNEFVTVNIFHHNKLRIFAIFDGVNLGDVRVIERSGCFASLTNRSRDSLSLI